MTDAPVAATRAAGPPKGRQIPWRLVLAGGLAAVTLVAGGLSAWIVADPAGPLGAAAPFTYAHDARAAHHMKAALGEEDFRAAEREIRLTLAQSPALATAWVRLAYVDTWRSRGLTPLAVSSLARSYEVSPLGPDVSTARVKLVLEAWSVLPPEIRAQGLTELEAMRWRRPEEAMALVQGITDAQARLAGGMTLADADAKAALRRSR